MLMGEARVQVQHLLTELELELDRQDPRAIAAARERIGAIADAIGQSYGR